MRPNLMLSSYTSIIYSSELEVGAVLETRVARPASHPHETRALNIR
jgi:hypothetical protein